MSPGRTSECGTLISDLTGGGIVWSYTPNGSSISNLTQQCDVTSSGYEAVVLDDSGASLGQSACNGFETAGWTASTQPGPLARYVAAGGVNQMKRDYAREQSDYQHEQHDSCPAAAGDAQTVARDADTVTADLNALNGDVENLQTGGIGPSRATCRA